MIEIKDLLRKHFFLIQFQQSTAYFQFNSKKNSLYSQDFAITINYGRTEQLDVKVEET